MKILITGGAGFLGHHVIEHILKTTEHEIIIIDRLSYASTGFDRLKDIGAYENPRINIFTHDFTQPIVEELAREIGEPDFIIHLGAETHVDRSIKDPMPFVKSNVIGTVNMLEYAKTLPNLKKFLYFSTDEVFGDAPKGVAYKEWDRYNSRNPYAASKAAGEEFALAYANTYQVPVIITHCMNIFGERQHKEKYIPIVINKILTGETLQIHCSNGNPASRSWIHARNVADAIMFLLKNGENREKYNICGEEYDNEQVANMIALLMKKKVNHELINYYSKRPGHDPRYFLDGTKLAELGWTPPKDFYASLEKTISWTLEHDRWLK